MNVFFSGLVACRIAVVALGFVISAFTFAGPGTHGPGGEHLDAPVAQGGAPRPRVEAKSELFELVGHLHADELSIMVNRFETNEAVLKAALEVSLGNMKAVAKFHDDHGDYAVDDAAFLKALAAPGEHALIFTLIAGSDSDLLEGTLKVTPTLAQDPAHGHSHVFEYALMALGGLALVVLVAFVWRRRVRNRVRYVSTGGLS